MNLIRLFFRRWSAVTLASGVLLLAGGSLAAADQPVKVNPIADLDPEFIRGADVSTLLAVEKGGGQFSDENGIPGDAMAILKAHGVNWIRLRIWNDPTNGEDVVVNNKILSKKGEKSGGGDNDLATTVTLAKRAKALGLKVLLDFHYSDFWADPGQQSIPKAWAGLDEPGLEKAVYGYTKQTLKTLAEAGASPDMVQVGNEIKAGMLWPIGKTYQAGPDEVIGGFDALAGLLNAGAKAVREQSPGIKIAIHLPEGGDQGLYRYVFDELTKRSVDYDVIGFSFYPYWHGTVDKLETNMNLCAVRYGKEVCVLETAYASTMTDADRSGNRFGPGMDKTGGYKATVQGQATAVREVMAAVADVAGGRGLGVFYWEPAWVPFTKVGWRSGEGDNWNNQTLFDAHGKALPSMSVFKLVGGSQPVEEPVPVSSFPVDVTVALDTKDWTFPDTVQTAYSDDAYRMTPVTWNPVDRASVNSPRHFTLKGVLTGTTVAATAVVTVVAVSNLLSDPGFESGSLGDWTVSDKNIMYVENNAGNAHSGNCTLKYWKDKPFHVVARKTVDGLKDGLYTLSCWAMGGGGEKSIKLSTKVGGVQGPETLMTNTGWLNWIDYTVRHIKVTGGSLEISIDIDGREGDWGNFDDLVLVRESDLN